MYKIYPSLLICVCVFYVAIVSANETAQELNALPDHVQQAIVVRTVQVQNYHATVSFWERDDSREWKEIIELIPASIGRNGLAPKGEKREGDGRTPSGTFSIKRAFGYHKDVVTKLDYRQVGDQDFWIDDPKANDYNLWIRGPKPKVSHEVLKREDHLYEYGIVVEYNTDPIIADHGSAIFIHVWREPGSPTAGCIAVSEQHIKRMLQELDADKRPVIILREK